MISSTDVGRDELNEMSKKERKVIPRFKLKSPSKRKEREILRAAKCAEHAK